MTPTRYRDQVAQLAKTDCDKGAEIAQSIGDPWFQAQAWSHLARWAEKPLPYARKAANVALETRDDYQKSAVRAWEIAALAERGFYSQARRSLMEAMELAVSISPMASRAEAIFLLFQAAFKISTDDAAKVAEELTTSCSSKQWRAKRAVKDAVRMMNREIQPREFFW